MNEICPKLQRALGVAVLAARLPASSLAPQTSQMAPRHQPTTCGGWGVVGGAGLWLHVQPWVWPHRDVFNVPGEVVETLSSPVWGCELRHGWLDKALMEIISDINMAVIFPNENLSVIIAFPWMTLNELFPLNTLLSDFTPPLGQLCYVPDTLLSWDFSWRWIVCL